MHREPRARWELLAGRGASVAIMKRSRVGALLLRGDSSGRGASEFAPRAAAADEADEDARRAETAADALLAASCSDLGAALDVLHLDYPRGLPEICPIPVLLQTQLRGLLSREGGWARELLEMQRSGKLRLCKAPLSGADAQVCIFNADLLDYSRRWSARLGGSAPAAAKVFARLLSFCAAKLHIESADVEHCFALTMADIAGDGAGDASSRRAAAGSGGARSGAAVDGRRAAPAASAHSAAAAAAAAATAAASATASCGSARAVIEALLREGFLLRALGGEAAAERYYFGAPSSGRFFGYVEAGRSELLRRLRRRLHSEMPRAEAEALKLTTTPLSPKFHILEAVGAGILELGGRPGGAVQTPMLRVRKG